MNDIYGQDVFDNIKLFKNSKLDMKPYIFKSLDFITHFLEYGLL